MTNRHKGSADALYTLEGSPGFGRVIPYSLQQVLAMFITNIVPITLIGTMCRPQLTDAQMLNNTQIAMILAGFATILQVTVLWKIGSGLPVFMGTSFTFMIPAAVVGSKYGYGGVIGAVLVGGIAEAGLAMCVRYWRRLIPPVLSAVVVIAIGLSLLPTAGSSCAGLDGAEDFGSWQNLTIALVTLAAALVWMHSTRGVKKQLGVLVGFFTGYIAALILGKVDMSGIVRGSWFSLPQILPYTPEFHADAIISIMIIYLVSATETMGDTYAIACGVLHREPTLEETRGALMTDGLCSTLSALLGGTPVTSYSENVGLTILTKVINRNVMRVGGLILILAGLFPPLGRVISTTPKPVIGGILMLVTGQIVVSGIQMFSSAGFTVRNKQIASISFAVGIGLTASSAIWEQMPESVQTVFGGNPMAVVFVTGFILNLVLPKKRDEDENEEPKREDTPASA